VSLKIKKFVTTYKHEEYVGFKMSGDSQYEFKHDSSDDYSGNGGKPRMYVCFGDLSNTNWVSIDDLKEIIRKAEKKEKRDVKQCS
jgi:hypothetical protein